MTKRQHPDWCSRTEPDDQEEHVSETVEVPDPLDAVPIRLRKLQPDSEDHLVTIEVEFMDEGETITYPLMLGQARGLVDAMGRLLP
jgi:hypothetical protein